jgi:hypothetical protein
VSERAGRYQRSAGGMVGAMIVLLLVVVAFVALRELNREELSPAQPRVDFARDSEAAQEQASFEVLAPPALPEGWRATSVRFVDGPSERWHLGLLTDEEKYVGVEQSAASVDSMVETHVDEEASQGEPVQVAGEQWSTWTDEGGDLALVRQAEGTTTLVVGARVPEAELVEFTASLR